MARTAGSQTAADTPERTRGGATGATHATPGINDEALRQVEARLVTSIAPGADWREINWSGGQTRAMHAGRGDPVVMIHGGMGNAADYASVFPPLAAHHELFALDRPGNGLADAFDYTSVDMWSHSATFMGQAMDALKLHSADVIANSMGGFFAIAFALRSPERVRRLVLLGAPVGAFRRLPIQLTALRWPVVRIVGRALMRRPSRASTRRFSGQVLVAHPERLTDVYLDFQTESQQRNIGSWLSLLDRCVTPRGLAPDMLIGDRWRELAVPTTLIWGERDAFDGPDHGVQLASLVRGGANLVRVPDAGHLPWLDQPALVVEAIEAALTG